VSAANADHYDRHERFKDRYKFHIFGCPHPPK
jgi:hypothetical protein